MLKKLIIPVATIGILAITSCGANKKLQKAESDLQSAQNEISQLQEKNAALNNNVETLKKDAATLDNRNKALTSEFNTYKKTCEENEEKLSIMREILMEEAENLARLEEVLDSALADFEERGVDVYMKGGLLYVSLEDDILYKTGS